MKLEASGEREELYYVYAKGKLYDVCTAINTAVKTADENLGRGGGRQPPEHLGTRK